MSTPELPVIHPFFRRKIQVGFRPSFNVALSGENNLTTEEGVRRKRTPAQVARIALIEALKDYNITSELHREIIAEASRLDTLATMNMPTLAAVMVYLSEYPELTPENFTEPVIGHFLDRLMRNFVNPGKKIVSPNQVEILEVRYSYKQTMLRYILKILALRANEQLVNQPLTDLGETILGSREDADEEII